MKLSDIISIVNLSSSYQKSPDEFLAIKRASRMFIFPSQLISAASITKLSTDKSTEYRAASRASVMFTKPSLSISAYSIGLHRVDLTGLNAAVTDFAAFIVTLHVTVCLRICP